ncbi:DNA repair protein RadA [Janthinobacterium sp. PLB04]|uniref:Uncharacterized protein n=1 Tax=Janthinobacterium lividum TaxID=29581 RepID=A0AAJ4MUE1_9BURK|nr:MULTISPECIES: hypothetical protein [Janthinobacterium]KAB0331010.1 hypothetical protein F3B38_04485 [Janthinobacterium lividum]QSX97222.1 hypothetical protein J3P46_04515 [Janthinobacterium lividum]UGQ37146.1 DNA repair protein RadA [Janthinobacterium sp. PLB04]
MPFTYSPENPAQIDRRVRIIEGHGRGSEVLIGSLRERQCYVLLGEPGSGKSTVLMQEAYATAGVCMTVRDFLVTPPTFPDTAVYLDALDEYRSDGSSTDRVCTLAAAMVSAKIARWRLSCRAEDWRLPGRDLRWS